MAHRSLGEGRRLLDHQATEAVALQFYWIEDRDSSITAR